MKALFEYLWFLIVVSLLLIFLSKVGGCDHQGDRTLEPTGSLPVQRPVKWLE